VSELVVADRVLLKVLWRVLHGVGPQHSDAWGLQRGDGDLSEPVRALPERLFLRGQRGSVSGGVQGTGLQQLPNKRAAEDDSPRARPRNKPAIGGDCSGKIRLPQRGTNKDFEAQRELHSGRATSQAFKK